MTDKTHGETQPKKTGQKLWNLNFLLLWQGQFVSAVGDVAYEIALGFWILAVTGSTGLMGTLLAPIAGVVVYRTDRKWLLVLMDAVRGVAVVLIAVAVYTGAAQVWMVFAAGIIIGLGAAFFNPAILSVVPDIVKREQIVQANSYFSIALLPLWNQYWLMLVCAALGGFFNAIVNVLIQSVMQLAVPQAMRGKVFGLLETLTQGLTPIGMAAGGFLGEFLPLKWVIFGAFAAIWLFIFPQLGSKGVREFFKLDHELDRSQN